MPYIQAGAIKYYTFKSFENQGLYHAVFTRNGGFSPSPWRSLNFGASVGDDKNRVVQNRKTAFQAINVKPDSVYDVFQVHSDRVVKTELPLSPGEEHIKADAIITRQTNVSLLMRFADCTPILLFDPISRSIGITHAGWVGTIEKIAEKTVLAMVKYYGSNPSDIIAAIGPPIGPDHYSIGTDVLEKVQCNFPESINQVVSYKNNRIFFDLWKANQIVLADIGVRKIEISGICTCCNLTDWYSHRGENGMTGRFGVVFGLHE